MWYELVQRRPFSTIDAGSPNIESLSRVLWAATSCLNFPTSKYICGGGPAGVPRDSSLTSPGLSGADNNGTVTAAGKCGSSAPAGTVIAGGTGGFATAAIAVLPPRTRLGSSVVGDDGVMTRVTTSSESAC